MARREIQVNVTFTEHEFRNIDEAMSRNFPDASKAEGVRIFCMLGLKMHKQEPGRVMQTLLDIDGEE